VHDPVSGEIWQASLFVMVLGASSYTYAEATRDQQLTAWLSAHMHAFEYFGGVPKLLILDFVPGNKIEIMCHSPLCAVTMRNPLRC
jgi:transposase